MDYFTARSVGPTCVCFCCQGLFFPRQVLVKDLEKIVKTAENFVSTKASKEIQEDFNRENFVSQIHNYASGYVCKTCDKHLSQAKVPKLAAIENLKFQDIPECLSRLSPLEQIMVSPYIGFIKLIELTPYALNSQLGIKGGVVNIEVDVNELVKVLPRKFNDMKIIQLAIKRKMSFKKPYKCEIVRPAYICEALRYLMTTPLYQKYGIKIDEEFFDRYEKKYDIELDFIVDEEDKSIIEEIDKIDIESKLSESSESEDENPMHDDEVLLHTTNLRTKNEGDEDELTSITFAPGEGKIPIPSYAIENIDEFCFPAIFGGYPMDAEKKLTYAELAKYQCRNVDGRHRNTTRILYIAKRRLENDIRNAANYQLRKIQGNKKLTVKDVSSKDSLRKLVEKDQAYVDYHFTKSCRSSPAFWQARRADTLAMVQQKGPPQIFLTLTITEPKNPELLAILHENARMGIISPEDAMRLSQYIKTILVKNDPVTVVLYYEEMIRHILRILQSKDGPLGENYVIEYYKKNESQNRGSMHVHMLCWCKDAPKYQMDSDNEDLIKFIDKIATCFYDPKNPYMAFQSHKHTFTCRMKGGKPCRFHFPKYVMPRTMILEPLKKDQVNDGVKWQNLVKNAKKIHTKMTEFFKTRTYVKFENILCELCMNEEN